MKKKFSFISIVYIFFAVFGTTGGLYGIGEKTVSIGGFSGWAAAEHREGITEARSIRPASVLMLSSAPGPSAAVYASSVYGGFSDFACDLSVSFDEPLAGLYRDSAGNYRVSVPPDLQAADRLYVRAGAGAAFFGGAGPVKIEPAGANALFAPGRRIGDFTLEFWIYPLNLENGETLLSWVSIAPSLSGAVLPSAAVQSVRCVSSRNTLRFSFENFFASTSGAQFFDIELSGFTPLIPRTWSHHLIRFDSVTGMAEYLVNGASEDIAYVTRNGRENSSLSSGGEVFTPLAGGSGAFYLGENFSGIMDEFKIFGFYAAPASLQRYNPAGGRMVTSAIDLQGSGSSIARIDASGGRIGDGGNEFRQDGALRFSDNSEINFFVRVSDNPYLLRESPWINFTPGASLSGINGRYVQIAADFYPSADGETSPYLSEIKITYLQKEPPLPPRNVTAAAADGAVALRWRSSPDINTSGYLVYYSSVRGELFGHEASLGHSPIDAGNRDGILIEGLNNGTLYYFRIASYDYIHETGEYIIGEFSSEVTARPLLGLDISDILR